LQTAQRLEEGGLAKQSERFQNSSKKEVAESLLKAITTQKARQKRTVL